VELRIAGRGDLDAAGRLLEPLSHAQARARFVGVSPAIEELEWADALVHPSLVEGMSNTLLEAMSHGVPCIASDIPPNREVLAGGQAGLLVPLADPAALAASLSSLARDATLGGCLADAARRRVEAQYDLGSIAKRYLGVYAELLGRSSAGC
jgi:glycosyltransferase involved in cell wall biosynthesis